MTQNFALNFLKLCENDFWVMRKLSLTSDLVYILSIMLDNNSFMLNTNVVVRPLKYLSIFFYYIREL